MQLPHLKISEYLLYLEKSNSLELKKFVDKFDGIAEKYNLTKNINELINCYAIMFSVLEKNKKIQAIKKIAMKKNISPILYFKYQIHFMFTLPYISTDMNIKRNAIVFYKNLINFRKEIKNLINNVKTENILHEGIGKIFKDKIFSFLKKVGESILFFGAALVKAYNFIFDFISLKIASALPGGMFLLEKGNKFLAGLILFFSITASPTLLCISQIHILLRSNIVKMGAEGVLNMDKIKEFFSSLSGITDEISWNDV